MPDLFELAPKFHRFGHTDIKILVVVDGSISTVESPGAFGIGRVVQLINTYSRRRSSFSIDTARSEPHFSGVASPENQGHVSPSFDFDDQDANGSYIIDGYDQSWMFGIRDEGAPPTVSQSEHRVLTDWMNKGAADDEFHHRPAPLRDARRGPVAPDPRPDRRDARPSPTPPKPGVIPDPGPLCLTRPPPQLLEEAVFEGIKLGTIIVMEEFADAPEELEALSDSRIETVLNEAMASAIDEAVKRSAASVIDDVQADLKTWSKVTEAQPRRKRTRK